MTAVQGTLSPGGVQGQSPCVLRDAVLSDVGLVLRFVQALAEYEKLRDHAVATEADFDRLLFGPRPSAWALIAEVDSVPVGMALWCYMVSTFVGKPTLYVEDVFVEPAQRGRGIGRLIFADLARRAVAEGCGRMEWSVLDWNAPSIAFYRSIGARPREGWTVQRLTGEALAALAQSS